MLLRWTEHSRERNNRFRVLYFGLMWRAHFRFHVPTTDSRNFHVVYEHACTLVTPLLTLCALLCRVGTSREFVVLLVFFEVGHEERLGEPRPFVGL